MKDLRDIIEEKNTAINELMGNQEESRSHEKLEEANIAVYDAFRVLSMYYDNMSKTQINRAVREIKKLQAVANGIRSKRNDIEDKFSSQMLAAAMVSHKQNAAIIDDKINGFKGGE